MSLRDLCGERSCFAALPPIMPGNLDSHVEAPALGVRRWNITHACEDPTSILDLTEAQIELGMRPALLTPDGWFNPGIASAHIPPLSLVHAWRKVRHWRTVFSREDVGHPGEIVHAHCFSAAMAAIRAGLPTVYDVAAPVGSETPNAGMWLLRSLRVAEGFVLNRAGAVVVHSQQIWNWALELGARAEDLFLIPDPVIAPSILLDNTAWLVSVTNTRPSVTFFASVPNEDEPNKDASASRDTLRFLLRSFAIIAEEIDGAHLLIETTDPDLIRAEAAAMNLSGHIDAVFPSDRDRALSSCDVVIGSGCPTLTGWGGTIAIDAFAYGRTLLAADTPDHRELSPNGRGCVWFTPGSERDLAYRASFLARNADFRAALGANGRAHLHATRSPQIVARRYDEVYRHALKRHQSGARPDLFHGVPALACC